MISPSLYEQCFSEALAFTKDLYGDEEIAGIMLEKFMHSTFVEWDESLKQMIKTYQNKDWPKLREFVHQLKGRLSYAGCEKFSNFFNLIKVACDEKKVDVIQNYFPEGMKIMTFLHERLLKFRNKEIVNVFKADPAIFENTDELLQSKCEFIQEDLASNEDRQKLKQIFNKESFVNKCEDVMESKFKMYNFIDVFYKNDGYLQKLIGFAQKNKIDEIRNTMDAVLDKIKFFEFHALELSIDEVLKKENNLEKTFPNFLFESSQLNKVLKENYSLEDDCIYEYKKIELDSSNKPSINKEKLENFSKLVFSREGKIMILIKFYEELNFDKMIDELVLLEKYANENGFANYAATISFLRNACFLNKEEDVQKYIKLLCEESQRTHKYIVDTLQLKNQIFIHYEEYLSKIKLGNKYRNVDLSKIPENDIDDEKISEKVDKKSSLNLKIMKESTEIFIKKPKKSEEIENANDSSGNMDQQDEIEDSLLDKKYKSMKYNVFPGPTIRNLSEIGSEIKNFQLYYVRDCKNDDYPFDSGLKCHIF